MSVAIKSYFTAFVGLRSSAVFAGDLRAASTLGAAATGADVAIAEDADDPLLGIDHGQMARASGAHQRGCVEDLAVGRQDRGRRLHQRADGRDASRGLVME